MAFADASIKFTVDDSTLLVGLSGIQRAVEEVSARMGAAASGANLHLEKHASLLDTLKTNWVAFSAAAVGAWMAVNKAMEFVEMGAKALQAEESFRLVAESSGIAADALLKNLDRAAAGTVDDSDLMQASIKGMLLGIKDNQLVKIMEGARIAARYAGTDVKTAFEDITNAIATDMPRALRRYGVITREETTQIQAAVTAGVGSGELLALVLAHMAVNTAKFGDAQANAAEKVQTFHARVKELWEKAGKAAINVFGFDLANTINEVTSVEEQLAEIARKAGSGEAGDVGTRSKLKQAQDALAAEQARVKTAAEWGKTSSEALKEAEKAIKDYEEELKQSNTIEAELIAGREKATQATFNARKGLGQTSLADEVAELKRRAELQWEDKAKRIEDDAAVTKATMEMTDQIFQHERSMGMKSLQDEIEFQRKKTAAYVEGSPAKMRAMESVYQKEQELRDKSNSAALGLLGQAIQRLKDKGITAASANDVNRELALLAGEQGRDAGIAANWAASGTNVRDLGTVQAGLSAAGIMNRASREGLGDPLDIFRRGSQLDPSRSGAAGGGTGIDAGYSGAMDAAYAAVDTGLGKIEARVNDSSSKIAQTIYGNVEEWFVRKLMGQVDRN